MDKSNFSKIMTTRNGIPQITININLDNPVNKLKKLYKPIDNQPETPKVLDKLYEKLNQGIYVKNRTEPIGGSA